MSTSKQPLFYRRFGTGPPLVLLHGLATPGEMFQPIWDTLAAHHELLIPDLRGTGQSAHLPGPYTVEQLAWQRQKSDASDDTQRPGGRRS